MKSSITDEFILTKEGRQIRKARLLYIDGDGKICDGCNETGKCATIQAINTPSRQGDIIILCKDCVWEILTAVNE
jgi:hypothetical protein